MTSLVDANPLSSSKTLKKVKEAQADETPPEKFSLFDLKGNSKHKHEVSKFNPGQNAETKFNFVPMPALSSQSNVNLFKFAHSSGQSITKEEIAPLEEKKSD